MPMTLRTLIRVAAVLSVVGLVASGCGRRGDLDPPSTPVDKQNQRSNTEATPVADKPFILDPLL
ncbi:hypothetical protein LJR030_003230 [Rhizobium sp. LjRoot30]|uniref:LPS translocon maturation chaperone LptM n=1 Tax=Rhizobium sp. LjRoot30 TaxID=3342320 RepID=UPI003ECCA675